MYPRILLLAAFALSAMAPRSRAVVEDFGVNFDLDYVFSGTSPAGTPPWVSVSLLDGVAANTVRFTFTANDLPGNEFVSNWYLNLNPAIDSEDLNFVIVSNSTGLSLSNVQTGENAFKADGDGYYDLLFQFPTNNANTRMTNGKSLVLDVSRASGLTSNDFLFQSAPGGGAGTYYSAAHIQDIGSSSGWIGTQTPETLPIPEPSNYAMWLGSIGFVAVLLHRVFRRASVRPAASSSQSV